MSKLALDTLLPLHSVTVTLQFTDSAAPRFFHQAALSALLRRLAGQADDYDTLIRVDTPESGRVAYRAGDYYRFTLTALAGGEALLGRMLKGLLRLPASARPVDAIAPFRDNLQCVALHDPYTEREIGALEQLAPYTQQSLEDELALWRAHTALHLHFVSPARLLKDKARREGLKGEQRYCRDARDIGVPLLFSRLHDALADLLRRRGQPRPPQRPEMPGGSLGEVHVFWVDAEYHGANGQSKPMGGLLGLVELAFDAPLSDDWWRMLLLAQHTGVGQRTAFGMGRIQLQRADGAVTWRRGSPAHSFLMLASAEDNLQAAWRHLNREPESQASLPDEAGEVLDLDADRAARAWDDLLERRYPAPPLRLVAMPKSDGERRLLMVAPFFDRMLQRALAQVLSPALEQLMYRRSYGYRRGRSRLGARNDIQAAWREGYRWVYESDIEDFFDSVDWRRLEQRLRALFGADPVVDAIMGWMRAPLEHEGREIQRCRGIPQGSPLSPLMANLLLDDFDQDMRAAGFRLVRYADDFVVLCRDPEQARAAGEAAVASLAEHGFELNPEKTRITAMKDGFRYLGYLFLNDMALDVGSGQAEVSVDRGRTVNGWLPLLAGRQPLPIRNEDEIDTLLAQLADRNVIPVGDAGASGSLICITGKPAIVTTRAGHMRVLRDDKVIHELPWQSLLALVLFGKHQITTQAMHAALRSDTAIHLASGAGSYQGVIWRGASEAHQLWLEQMLHCQDEEHRLLLAREVVNARIGHLRELLRQRQWGGARDTLDRALRGVAGARDIEQLRGYEGLATRAFFAQVAESVPQELGFKGRNRRPPRDPLNVLLSLGYTLLYGYSDSVLRAVGLFPWRGFYHQPRGGHAALASDLMEPFRHVVERVALNLLLRRQIRVGDFEWEPGAGHCHIQAAARRKFLAALVARFETPVRARGGGEPARLFDHLYRQALSLRARIRGEGEFKAWRMR